MSSGIQTYPDTDTVCGIHDRPAELAKQAHKFRTPTTNRTIGLARGRRNCDKYKQRQRRSAKLHEGDGGGHLQPSLAFPRADDEDLSTSSCANNTDDRTSREGRLPQGNPGRSARVPKDAERPCNSSPSLQPARCCHPDGFQQKSSWAACGTTTTTQKKKPGLCPDVCLPAVPTHGALRRANRRRIVRNAFPDHRRREPLH